MNRQEIVAKYWNNEEIADAIRELDHIFPDLGYQYKTPEEKEQQYLNLLDSHLDFHQAYLERDHRRLLEKINEIKELRAKLVS